MRDETSSAKCEGEPTLVCFALKEEAAAFRKRVTGRTDISVLITGIGRANAARSVREYLRHHAPRHVFTCGFAGGLNPQLQLGEVIFATADAALRERLINSKTRLATFVCVATIATTVAEKQQLRTTTQADAVEMESEVIQAVCAERGIPCVTLRVISDTAREDLPLDFNQLTRPDQSLHFGKLALAIVKAPGKIPALLRLQKQTSFAAMQLAVKLGQVLP